MRWYERTILLLFVVGFAACATTEVKTVWKDEAYQVQPKRVLVIALFKKPSVRRMVEDGLRNSLKHRGTDAATGYEVFSGNVIPSKEMVVEQVKAGGFDAVLLTRLIDTRTETRTLSSSQPSNFATARFAAPMSGYYSQSSAAMSSSSYAVDDKFAIVETNLYDAATEKLVWTAASDTWMGAEDQKLVKQFVALITDSLLKQKIVP